jgi:fructokinase
MSSNAASPRIPWIVCVGETLWDVLPGGESLGGALFNVAAHLAKLGARASLLTCVGDDSRGRAARAKAEQYAIDVSLWQADAEFPTGIAQAELQPDGSATYCFPAPSAWDLIALSEDARKMAAAADAVVFGTLAQRSTISRESIRELCSLASFTVLDLNLRSPHFDRKLVIESLALADMVKVNNDECRQVADWLNCAATPRAVAQRLQTEFDVSSLCVTAGAQGAWLRTAAGEYQVEAPPVEKVVDTIGAGDSFLAMLLFELLRGSEPQAALARAARLASIVVGAAGAVPDYAID